MKVVICDASPVDREKSAQLIKQFAHEHDIDVDIRIYDSGNPLLFAFDNPKFFADIIFLDINLPGVSGMEVAEKLREQEYRNEIIFITNSKDHMLKGYDVGAFHYIVKNETSKSHFERIFLSAVESVKFKRQKTCLFTGGGEHRNIPVHSIRYFSVSRKIVTVHFGNYDTFDFPSTLGKLENEFEMHGFFRVQRSFLVSLYHITSLNYKEITMSDGMVISIKRGMYTAIKDAIVDYLGTSVG